jgi:hypothetical protein
MPIAPGTRVGRYEIAAQIGAGGNWKLPAR